MDFNEYIKQGNTLWQEQKYGPAIESFEAALKLDPNNTELQQWIEGMKMQAVQIAEFQKKMAEAAINEAKLRANFLRELYGVNLEDIMDVDKVIAEYTQVLKNNPNHDSAKKILASSYYISGLIFESKKEHSQAAEAYSQAIYYEPNHALAYKCRGRVNLAIGKIENCDQAIEDFKKANLDDAKLKQQLAVVYWKRATEYDQKGDYGKVIEDCERILEFDPNNSNARELLEMAKDAMQK